MRLVIAPYVNPGFLWVNPCPHGIIPFLYRRRACILSSSAGLSFPQPLTRIHFCATYCFHDVERLKPGRQPTPACQTTKLAQRRVDESGSATDGGRRQLPSSNCIVFFSESRLSSVLRRARLITRVSRLACCRMFVACERPSLLTSRNTPYLYRNPNYIPSASVNY